MREDDFGRGFEGPRALWVRLAWFGLGVAIGAGIMWLVLEPLLPPARVFP